MECDGSNKGSYAWRSIIQAQHVIELGSSWRIRDEKSVHIREDKWLPKTPVAKIVAPIGVLP